MPAAFWKYFHIDAYHPSISFLLMYHLTSTASVLKLPKKLQEKKQSKENINVSMFLSNSDQPDLRYG